ncbi:hypothetical protein P154DRAFT_540157 [Amniculicola lignicola CBS 123094]|uniref:Uncharacterized protein n=1 Tax=Amniculicola lignicola CBS 123094 TaxID=1392246 RepID=A0A6A5W3Q5_9PLEO|nr:hypothetical protein P154DRAFT_540157 [Amniculicola lignicola CBS 123094]
MHLFNLLAVALVAQLGTQAYPLGRKIQMETHTSWIAPSERRGMPFPGRAVVATRTRESVYETHTGTPDNGLLQDRADGDRLNGFEHEEREATDGPGIRYAYHDQRRREWRNPYKRRHNRGRGRAHGRH